LSGFLSSLWDQDLLDFRVEEGPNRMAQAIVTEFRVMGRFGDREDFIIHMNSLNLPGIGAEVWERLAPQFDYGRTRGRSILVWGTTVLMGLVTVAGAVTGGKRIGQALFERRMEREEHERAKRELERMQELERQARQQRAAFEREWKMVFVEELTRRLDEENIPEPLREALRGEALATGHPVRLTGKFVSPLDREEKEFTAEALFLMVFEKEGTFALELGFTHGQPPPEVLQSPGSPLERLWEDTIDRWLFRFENVTQLHIESARRLEPGIAPKAAPALEETPRKGLPPAPGELQRKPQAPPVIRPYEEFQEEVGYPIPTKQQIQAMLQQVVEKVYRVGFREFSHDDFDHGHLIYKDPRREGVEPEDHQLAGVLYHTQERRVFDKEFRSLFQVYDPERILPPVKAVELIPDEIWLNSLFRKSIENLEKYGTVTPLLLGIGPSKVEIKFRPVDPKKLSKPLEESDNVIQVTLPDGQVIWLAITYSTLPPAGLEENSVVVMVAGDLLGEVSLQEFLVNKLTPFQDQLAPLSIGILAFILAEILDNLNRHAYATQQGGPFQTQVTFVWNDTEVEVTIVDQQQQDFNLLQRIEQAPDLLGEHAETVAQREAAGIPGKAGFPLLKQSLKGRVFTIRAHDFLGQGNQNVLVFPRASPTGLEEETGKVLGRLAQTLEGAGVLVVDGEQVLQSRAGLEELILRAPAPIQERFIVLAYDPQQAARLREELPRLKIVEGFVELVAALMAHPAADRIAVLSETLSLVEQLERVVPPSMTVIHLELGAAFRLLLAALGAAKAELDRIDAVGLEEALTRLRAA